MRPSVVTEGSRRPGPGHAHRRRSARRLALGYTSIAAAKWGDLRVCLTRPPTPARIALSVLRQANAYALADVFTRSRGINGLSREIFRGRN